jgi:hypothetical protein
MDISVPSGYCDFGSSRTAFVRRVFGRKDAAPIEVWKNEHGELIIPNDANPRHFPPPFSVATTKILMALEAGELTAHFSPNESVTQWYWQAGSALDAVENGEIKNRPVYLERNEFDEWLHVQPIAKEKSEESPSDNSNSTERSATTENVSKAVLRRWYKSIYMPSFESSERHPSREADLQAARKHFGKRISDKMVRDVRNAEAPNEWKMAGAPKKASK